MVTNSMTCKSITLLCLALIEEENCIYKDSRVYCKVCHNMEVFHTH